MMCNDVVWCQHGVPVWWWDLRNQFFWDKHQEKRKESFLGVKLLPHRSSFPDVSCVIAAGVMSEHMLFSSSWLGKVVFFVKWCELRSHLAGSLGTPPSPSQCLWTAVFPDPTLFCCFALIFFPPFFFPFSPFPTSALWSLRDYPERDSQGSVCTS